ncbi:ribonuclease H-like domain-containing protein [Tanacetum coccineum]
MFVHDYTDDEYSVYSDDNVTLISRLDVSHPFHLHPNDSSALTIVSIKLNGTKNYQVWSCIMLLSLQGKNKIGFIDDTCKRSNIDEILGTQWDMLNASILSWILNSIYEELYLGQIFSKSASHVWEELNETYDKVDESRSESSTHVANVPNRGNSQRSSTSENVSRISKVTRPTDNGNTRPTGVLLLYNLDKHRFIFLKDVKFFESVFPFKNKIAYKIDTEKTGFKDFNHLNLFDNDYPRIPNDDERVEHEHVSDISFSPHLGSNIEPHSEFFNNGNENSPLHSSDNISASEDDEIATLDENQENSKGSLNQNSNSDTQDVINPIRSFRPYVLKKF